MLDSDENYHDFKYGAAFQFAHEVREAIVNNFFDGFIDFASDLEKQICRPQKNTLLHDVIEYIIKDHFSTIYFNDSYSEYNFEDFRDIIENGEVIELFYQYQIKFMSMEELDRSGDLEQKSGKIRAIPTLLV